jgi:hypothetical protein
MATRSNIGIVNDNGSVTGIYCHWDGYPENNGKLLLKHYTDSERINGLMSLGSLSYLAENLYSDKKAHSFRNPVDGVCVAYGRDRGETGTNSKTFDNISEFEEFADNSWSDYQYLFNNGKWQYRNHNGTWNELTARVCKCD